MISIAFLETLSDLRQSGVMKKGIGMAHLLRSLLGPVGGWRKGKAGQEKGDSHQGKHNELDQKQVSPREEICLRQEALVVEC